VSRAKGGDLAGIGLLCFAATFAVILAVAGVQAAAVGAASLGLAALGHPPGPAAISIAVAAGGAVTALGLSRQWTPERDAALGSAVAVASVLVLRPILGT
jgi:hypothetical protein